MQQSSVQRVRDIMDGDVLVAQIFDFSQTGPVIFPTPDSAELQCGFGFVGSDKIIPAHVHNDVPRSLSHTSEFILVLEGRMEVTFITADARCLGSEIFERQQGFLQYVGGHKITIFAGTRYFELKQGPYFGNLKDKTILVDLSC